MLELSRLGFMLGSNHSGAGIRLWSRSIARSIPSVCKGFTAIGLVALSMAIPATAQNAEVQQKLAAVQQAMAQNKQRLQQYQWTETSGGRLKQRVVAKKKAEMQDYMVDVKRLLGMYVPPDPQRMQEAFQAGRLSVNPSGGIVNLIFRDYAQPGDQMTLSFDPNTKKVISVSVNTYMGDAKDAVTLQIQMGGLPDGTSYVQQSVLSASAKQLVVTTSNSNYQRVAG
jgi:hypothetical protein